MEKTDPAYARKLSFTGMFKALKTTLSSDRIDLDPKCDIAFKAIFTHGAEGRIALLGLINAVLDPPPGKRVERIEYLNTHVYVMFRDQKKPVMDILVRTEDQRLINIEMQVDDHDNFFHRTQHYLACMLHDQSVSGKAYDRLVPCIAINVLDYRLDTGLSDFHTCYRMHEASLHTPMPCPLTEIHFIELPKLMEYSKGEMPRSTLGKWAFYFKDLPENRYPVILRQILADEKEIRMAEQGRIKFSLREKFLYAYRSYQRARLDETSSRIYLREKALREGRQEGLAEGIEQGLAEGIEQGMVQEKLNIARRMKAQQLDAEIISSMTGLSTEAIDGL